MSVSERRKGLRGQQEVQRIFREAGIDLAKLAAQGDRFLHRTGHEPLHVEVKRQERLQLPMWLRQAKDEALKGAVPVVAFRQSRGEWYACLPLDDLVRLAQ